jgi:hypothetical protein
LSIVSIHIRKQDLRICISYQTPINKQENCEQGEEEKCILLVGKPEWKRPLGVDGRILLKWILKKYVTVTAGFIWLRIR